MPPLKRTSSSFLDRRHFLAGLAAAVNLSALARGQTQFAFNARELAEYRLTAPALKRFGHATALIAAAMRRDSRFVDEPLITREIAVSGDAPEMAAALQKRLDTEPALSAALFAADMSAREYATFALSLFAARMAQGFLKSGAMRRVPDGAAADNVAFVTAHETEVAALLRQLHLE